MPSPVGSLTSCSSVDSRTCAVAEHDLGQLLEPLLLFFDQELGVTDHVDEEDMPDLESELVLGSGVILLLSLYRRFSSQSFWKRGSFRSGSNIGSSRSSAGVSGTVNPNTPADGIESSFCKAATARSGSPICADTRARISIAPGTF